MEWSLETELTRLAGVRDVREALRAAGICSARCGACELQVDQAFERSGAETYLLRATVQHSFAAATTFVVKACVALGECSGVETIVNEWLRRRNILRLARVAVPQLYLAGNGLICEEFVAHDLDTVVAKPVAGASREPVLGDLGYALGTIRACGFLLLSTTNFRSRGTDAVVVDFGQDLGAPGLASTETTSDITELLTRWERDGITLAASELRALSRGYEFGMERSGEPA